MFWGGRAPRSRSEDRCDGAGSEAEGARPPVKPGPMLPVLGVLVFRSDTALVESRSSGLRIDTARRGRGWFCPAYRIGFTAGDGDDARDGGQGPLFGAGQMKVVHPLAFGAWGGGFPFLALSYSGRFGTRLTLGRAQIALAEAHGKRSIQPHFHSDDGPPQSGTNVALRDLPDLSIEPDWVSLRSFGRSH